jgi:hypothetical protein
METAGTSEAASTLSLTALAEGTDRNHPAESQERGTENSDQPQSKHILISGEGVTGGWPNIRGPSR